MQPQKCRITPAACAHTAHGATAQTHDLRQESAACEARGSAAYSVQHPTFGVYLALGTTPMPSCGVVELKSPYPFTATVQRLLAAFSGKGIKVFATIDQQAEARAVGLTMPPTTLIVFGNPRVGTPIMLANPRAGIDLPLKVLVCELQPDDIAVMFAAASEIIARHSLPTELAPGLLGAEHLIAATLNENADA